MLLLVAVHDARFVAVMHVARVSHILTLNSHDFARYPGISPMTPEQALALTP